MKRPVVTVSGGPKQKLLPGYVIRALSYRSIADVCRGFVQKNPGQKIREVLAGREISDDLVHIADMFCSLQNERNEADYNFVCSYAKEQTMIIIDDTKVAHQKWQNIKDNKAAKIFLVTLLMHQSLKTSR